jgi:hypothetical protein
MASFNKPQTKFLMSILSNFPITRRLPAQHPDALFESRANDSPRHVPARFEPCLAQPALQRGLNIPKRP